MNTDALYLRERFAPADPAPPPEDGDTEPLDAQGEATLHHIVRTPRAQGGRTSAPPPRRAQRRIGLVAAAAAVVLVAVAAVIIAPLRGGSRPAYAATPPLLEYPMPGKKAPSAHDLLLRLASRAEQQPVPAQHGTYHYTKTRSWALNTAVGGGTACSVVVPEITESWVARDGSGQTRAHTGTPQVPSGDEGPLCDAAKPQNQTTRDRRLGPDKARSWPIDALPTNTDQLARHLVRSQSGGQPRKLKIIEAIRSFHAAGQPIPPKLQAGMLRVLADIPSMVERGHVTDRAGRDGIAVSTNSDNSGLPTRYTLVFDSDTGSLTGYEEMLTKTAGKLNVPVPSVVSYVVYLQSSYTDTLDEPSTTPQPRHS